jgi:hypothetical protein
MAEVLLEIRRVLKPGGLFHVVVKSTEDYWPKRVGGKRNTLGMTEVMDGTLLYRRYYSAAELKTTLEKAGFTLLDPGVTPSNERLFKDQLRQHPDEHMSALLSVTVRSPARILLNSASGNAVGHGPLNDVTSIFRLAWRPMALGALAMAGLSFAGLSGRALPVGLLVMYVALGWEQGWLKRFRLKEWRTVTMALGLGLGSSGGYASMDAQDANSTAARLTVEQRAFAAQVTAIVGEKPMDLGVADYMDKAARAAVKMAAEGQAEGPLFPSLEDMKRTPVLFVDARSVATPKQRSSLANFLKDKPNAVIFTNADNLTMKGFDVRVKPEAFTALKTPEENIPSGLLEISLASFGPELTALAQGPGLQFFQTAVLKLNVAGVDEVIAESAKRSWLLTDAFKLLSPAESVNWANVLDALTAIARSA